MNTEDQPAFPHQNTDEHYNGLTKREMMAATVSIGSIEKWSQELTEALAGYSEPSYSKEPLKYMQFLCDAEAKLRTMKADALIAELNRDKI